MCEDSERYPIEKHEYTKFIGKLLPHRIGQILKELGFTTWIVQGQSNGVDLKAYDNCNNLVLVAEINNWSTHSELSEKRRKLIIENLSQYDCRRLYIYTTMKRESVLGDIETYDISLLKIGYQLLPKYFYDFFTKKKQVELRRIDSKETSKDIRQKIIQHLQSSNIEIEPINTISLDILQI